MLFAMQDKAAEFLVKEIRISTGETKPFSFEWLSGLPIKDGNLVYEKVNTLVQESSLNSEDKKK